MSRYLYKKIQNISPESLNFQHSGLKLTTLRSDPSRFLNETDNPAGNLSDCTKMIMTQNLADL